MLGLDTQIFQLLNTLAISCTSWESDAIKRRSFNDDPAGYRTPSPDIRTGDSKMVDTTRFGLDDLTDAVLEARINVQKKDVQTASKNTIENRWNGGRYVTESQMAHLRAVKAVDEADVKSIMVNVDIKDKLGQTIGQKKVKKFYNRTVTRINNGISNNLIVEEADVLSTNLALAQNAADLESKNSDLGHMRAELSASRAVHKNREAAQIAKVMADKKLAFRNRSDIYARAVAAKKLITVDLEEHIAETTPLVVA